MSVYFSEMYPIPLRLFSSVLLYISFNVCLRRVHGVEAPLLSLHAFVGIVSVFALMLILRLMDELKDKEIDRELFRDRPLPSGRVLETDISFTLVTVIAMYIIVNMIAGAVVWMAVIVLGYSLLMFKYFFIHEILRKHLLLNLATHTPIIPLNLVYLCFLFSAEHHLHISNLNWPLCLALIGMYWAMFFAWEISRKIRAQEEENAYVTYSQILGRVGAVFVASGAQTIAFLLGLFFSSTLSLPWQFAVLLSAAYGMTMWSHIRFILNPSPVTSKLKPYAERYILSALAASVVAIGGLK